jgi:hypothetical protein
MHLVLEDGSTAGQVTTRGLSLLESRNVYVSRVLVAVPFLLGAKAWTHYNDVIGIVFPVSLEIDTTSLGTNLVHGFGKRSIDGGR